VSDRKRRTDTDGGWLFELDGTIVMAEKRAKTGQILTADVRIGVV
jgi:hypothetical protein